MIRSHLRVFQKFNLDIGYWIKNLDENCKENIVKVLVGNKIDLEGSRQVSYREGKELADQNGLLFFETSAKSGSSIEDVFMTATKVIVEKNPEIVKEGKNKGISLNSSNNNGTTGACC